MEVIDKKIDYELKKYIKENYVKVENILKKHNNKINYVNIYHRSWNINNCEKIIDNLKNKYSFDTSKLISLGFISAPVNCDNQFFHIDYKGNTNTYFIPLIDLNNNNGTEYIEFDNKFYNINLLDKLNIISNIYLSQDDVVNHLSKIDVNPNTYKFKFLNCEKWCMVKLPYYCLHRGRTNNGFCDRIMFQIVFYKDDALNYNIPNEHYYDDAELDDEKNKILDNRKNYE